MSVGRGLMQLSMTLDSLDISIWLAFVSVILILTSEVLSHFTAAHGLLIDKTRLRLLALVTGLLFLAIISFRAYSLIRH